MKRHRLPSYHPNTVETDKGPAVKLKRWSPETEAFHHTNSTVSPEYQFSDEMLEV